MTDIDATEPGLAITSWADDEHLKLYVLPEHDAELRQLLDQFGISHAIGGEFSAGASLSIAVLSTLGGASFWLALNRVLATFLQRHGNKKIEIDGDTVTVEGYDMDDVQRVVELVWNRNKVEGEQWRAGNADLQEKVRRLTGTEPGEDSNLA